MKPLKGSLYEDKSQEWKEVREAVKAAEDCLPYLTKSKLGNYECPFCGSGTGPNGTGALKYYKKSNSCGCFACPTKLPGADPSKQSIKHDSIELYMNAYGVDYKTAVVELARKHNIPLPGEAENGTKTAAAAPARKKPEPAKKTPEKPQIDAQDAPKKDFTDYFRQCAARLRDPAALAYLEKRGLSEDAAELLDLGFDPEADPANKPGAAPGEWKPHPAPRIITPAGKYCFVGRRTDGVKTFEKLNAGNGTADISGLDKILNDDAEIYFAPEFIAIGEGSFSVLSVVEASLFSCWPITLNSATNAGRLLELLEKEKERLPKYANGEYYNFLICTDNDTSGHTAAETLEAGLDRLGLHCIADFLGEDPGEDPNDLLLRIGADEMNKRIDAARERLAKKYENPTTPANIPNPFSLSAEDIAETPEEDTSAADPDAAQAEEAGKAGEETPPPPKPGPLDAFLEEIQTRRFEPIATGIKDIDRALQGGFMRRTLITLAAAPGAGKTAIAQWIFENMAAAGQNVLYINLEMDRAQLLARSIARIAWRLRGKSGRGFSALDVLRAYEWTPEQQHLFLQAVEEYRERIAPHFLYNPGALNGSNDIDRILSVMKDATDKARAAGQPEPLICIDYLQIIAADGNTTAEQIQQIIKQLKDFAIANNTVVFLITAQNRAANKAGVSEMESGRDTSAIEYSGDLMLGLVYTAIENGETWTYYERDEAGKILQDRNGNPKKVTKEYDLDRIRELQRKAYDAGEDPDPVCNRLTLKVLKNRFGASERRANFIFDGEHGTFHQVERENRPDPEDQDKRGEWQQEGFAGTKAPF